MVDYGRLHVFQSTLPGWGATTRLTRSCIASFYFNPRSPDGERHGTCAPPSYFVENFNPRSPDGERPGVHERVGSARGISIHAPRMGSDAHEQRQHVPHVEISIHAPRMGSDSQLHHLIDCRAYFNPRSPDGERRRKRSTVTPFSNFNPRSPDGERHDSGVLHAVESMISIHAPRMGSDHAAYSGTITAQISIHAPRMGSDIRAHGTGGSGRISIHAPRMGSDAAERRRLAGGLLISIHAPRMGSDLVGQDAVGRLPNFNPRSPDGERPPF